MLNICKWLLIIVYLFSLKCKCKRSRLYPTHAKAMNGFYTPLYKNLIVIENFILHLTHVSDVRDSGFRKPQTYTPEELYKVAYDYIEEDHVDGKGNPKNLKQND